MNNHATIEENGKKRAATQEEIEKFRIVYERILQGICPRGCAELEWENEFNARCPVCGSRCNSKQPYAKKAADQIM